MNKKIFVPMATIGLLSSAILFANSASADTNMNVQAQDGIVSTDVNPLSTTSRGQVLISGTGSDGLDLTSGNTVTTGNLDFAYSGSFPIGSVGWNKETEFVLVLPSELDEAAQDASFINYFSGVYDGPGWGANPYQYQTSDIRMGVDNDGNTIVRFTNPPTTWGIGNGLHFNVNVSLDLGSFVTKTGIRIADADNGTHYDFNGAVVTDHDYTNIGDDNTVTSLNTHALDPGYDLLQQVPTIEDVYDTDTTISGTGVPGAQIEIKAGGKVIGTGTVGANGIYHITVPKQNEGVTIEVRQNTGVGWSTAATTIVQHKVSEIPAPQVDDIIEGDTVVTGTGQTPGNTIIITDNKTGKELGRGFVDGNGNYSIPIPPQTAYTLIDVVESDGKDTSPVNTVTVHQKVNSKITSVANFSVSTDTNITGTFDGNTAAKISVLVDGKVHGPFDIKDPSSGTFSIVASQFQINASSSVSVELLDANGLKIDSKAVTVV